MAVRSLARDNEVSRRFVALCPSSRLGFSIDGIQRRLKRSSYCLKKLSSSSNRSVFSGNCCREGHGGDGEVEVMKAALDERRVMILADFFAGFMGYLLAASLPASAGGRASSF